MQKRVAGTLINLMNFETFGGKIENGLRNDQKALPREGFHNTISKRRETL